MNPIILVASVEENTIDQIETTIENYTAWDFEFASQRSTFQ